MQELKKEKKNLYNKGFKLRNVFSLSSINANIKHRFFLEKYILALKNQLYTKLEYDDATINKKFNGIIIKLVFTNIIIAILGFIIYGFKLYSFVIIGFAIYIATKMMLDKYALGEVNTVTRQIPFFIDEIKSAYYEKKMVAPSVYEASLNIPFEVSCEAKKMVKILESSEATVEIEKYNRECDNRFLKLLLNILYLTREYGDNNKNVGYDNDLIQDNMANTATSSILVKNLNSLLEEVNIEINKLNFLEMKFQGLIFTSIFPLIFINLIEKWATSNFEILNSFYDSICGFIIKNIIVFITIFIASIIMRIKASEEGTIMRKKFKMQDALDEEKRKKIEKRVEKLLKVVMPTTKSNAYKKLLKKLEGNYLISIKDYYKRKMKTFSISFALMLAMTIYANFYLECITLNQVILEIIIILILSYLLSYLVDLNVIIDKTLNIEEEKREADNFRCIILILIQHSFASCEVILSSLEKYSMIYKNRLRRCINDYESDSEYALVKLKNEVRERGFIKIIRCLIQASKNIKVKEAFSFIEAERDFYKEEVKIRNENQIIKKNNLAQMISMMPYYMLIFLYFILPMVIIGASELKELLNQIRSM